MTAKTVSYAALAVVLAGLLSLAAAGQLVLSVMDSPGVSGYPGGFSHAFVMQAPRFFLWLPLLPVIYRISRNIPFDLSGPGHWIPVQVGAATGIVLLHFSVRSAFMSSIGHGYSPQGVGPFLEHFATAGVTEIPLTLVEYLLILGSMIGVVWARRHRERELLTSRLSGQLAESSLHALRMQLNPHFLFNTMNSISSLVRTSNNSEAVSMISGLSDLMRYVLVDNPPLEVPLVEELEILNKYLGIERARFGDRIEIVVDVQTDVLPALVPSLILQPLVENSIRHGLSSTSAPGEIRVCARRRNGRVHLEVRDNGVGLSGPSPTRGVGLTNTRERLATLYGKDSSFSIHNGTHRGTVASIELPYHTTPMPATGQ